MTWVIGTPSSLGGGIGISDVRVTFGNGETRDCLQKIYPIGPFFAVGFSGSVQFGFHAIENLQRHFSVVEPGHAWKPGWVAFKWYRQARRAFARAPAVVKVNGAALMLVGVSPTADVGIPGFARATVAIMRAPDFFPKILRLNEVGSIGSGSGLELYVKELEDLQKDRYTLLQMEVGGHGGYGRTLLHFLQQMVQQHPSPSVSHHFHLCLVRRGETKLMKSDHTFFSQDGSPVEVTMPPVATSWTEFAAMCDDLAVEATQAAC